MDYFFSMECDNMNRDRWLWENRRSFCLENVRRLFVGTLLVVAGCMYEPVEDGYGPISEFTDSGLAVARIYAVPATPLGWHIVHTYLVVKSADSNECDRWECWPRSEEPYGFLRKNLYGPEEDFGLGSVMVLDELIGPKAEIVADFIADHYQDYPYIEEYSLVNGPNCNTFIAWIAYSTNWTVEFPDSAWGKDYPVTP
jgi:hypothetical protein